MMGLLYNAPILEAHYTVGQLGKLQIVGDHHQSTVIFKSPATFWLVLTSKLPVGSSARMMEGRVISARAMAAHCWPPPESI